MGTDVLFIALSFATFALLGAPFRLCLPTTISGGFFCSPVIGFCIFGMASTVAYRLGIPLHLTAVFAVALAIAVPILVPPARSAELLWVLGFAASVGVVAIAPYWIGGLQFAAFQGNPYDQMNYISIASAVSHLSYQSISTFSQATANDFNAFVAGQLSARPTVGMVLAAFRWFLLRTTVEAAYPYMALLQCLAFSGMIFLLRAVLRATWSLAFVLAAAFSLGTHVQLIEDINAWSQLASVSIITTLAALLVLAFSKEAKFILIVPLTLLAAGNLYFYPESTPVSGLAAAAMIANKLLHNDRAIALRAMASFGAAGVGALLLCLPNVPGSIGTLYNQTGNVSLPTEWFFHYSSYLLGTDADLPNLISTGRGSPYDWFSLPIDFLTGAVGAYFAGPPAGMPSRIAVTWKLALYACLAMLTVSIYKAYKAANELQQTFLIGAFGSLLLPAACFASYHIWAGGKALLMVAPYLFVLFCCPILINGISWRWQLLPGFLVLANLAFGLDRLPAAANPRGIVHREPYPTIPSLKQALDWDIAKYATAFPSCQEIAVDLDDPILSRYVQTFLSDLNVRWHSKRPLNSYYGQGPKIGLQPQKSYDCLVTDQLEVSPIIRVFSLRTPS